MLLILIIMCKYINIELSIYYAFKQAVLSVVKLKNKNIENKFV